VDYGRGFLARFDPGSGKVEEWQTPAGASSLPYHRPGARAVARTGISGALRRHSSFLREKHDARRRDDVSNSGDRVDASTKFTLDFANGVRSLRLIENLTDSEQFTRIL
jgi:hypothetical protein